MFQFTQWLKERRKSLDLTQADLAKQVGCSLVTIYKIEAGERRPSRQIAERLAVCLEIPPEQHAFFIKQARAIQQPGEITMPSAIVAPPASAAAQGTPGTPAAPDTAMLPTPIPDTPIPPTRMIGRTAELAQIETYLREKRRRLITLLGPAGVGKTRLGMEIAHRMAGSFRDGACWIALSDISDPALVAPAIAHALHIREQASNPLRNVLADALRERNLLMILDNFEQIVAAAPLIGALLMACPGLAIVITSRIPLRVRGEQHYPILPLSLPDPGDDLAALANNQAIELFIERAQSFNPHFALTPGNGAAIAALCRRLDGLPLAIELVAGQTKFMAPQRILEQIRPNALPFLANGPVDVDERHRTLWHAFDWSYNLLPPAIQRIFAGLGVFNGQWSAEAMAAVCEEQEGFGANHTIRHLLETGLVQTAWENAAGPQYALLETTRDYAVDRLIQAGQHQQTCERHAAYYCGLAEAAAPRLTGPGQQDALTHIQHNLANLRAALAWSLAAAPALTERLGAALWRFWWLCGYFTEGLNWINQILELPTQSPQLRATILNGAGSINLELNNIPLAQRYHREALALRQQLNDTLGIAGSLGNLGNLARQQNNPSEAHGLFSESLAAFQAIDHAWGIATTLLNLGTVAEDLENFAEAQRCYEESLEHYRALGDQHGVALALGNIAGIALLQEDYIQAAATYRQVLALRQSVDNHGGIATALEALARVLVMQGQAQSAARLWGAADGLRSTMNLPVQPSYLPHHTRTISLLRERLDLELLRASLDAGKQADLDKVIATALAM